MTVYLRANLYIQNVQIRRESAAPFAIVIINVRSRRQRRLRATSGTNRRQSNFCRAVEREKFANSSVRRFVRETSDRGGYTELLGMPLVAEILIVHGRFTVPPLKCSWPLPVIGASRGLSLIFVRLVSCADPFLPRETTTTITRTTTATMSHMITHKNYVHTLRKIFGGILSFFFPGITLNI